MHTHSRTCPYARACACRRTHTHAHTHTHTHTQARPPPPPTAFATPMPPARPTGEGGDSWACPGFLMRCAGMAQRWLQRTLRGNNRQVWRLAKYAWQLRGWWCVCVLAWSWSCAGNTPCGTATHVHKQHRCLFNTRYNAYWFIIVKLTWLVLGGDLVARSHRVEQLTAL